MIIKELFQDDKQILNILRDYVASVSRKPMLGSAYLTRQGEFINMGESVDYSHGDVISYLENEDITMFEDSWEFSDAFGYIRLNSGLNDDNAAYVEFNEEKPTDEQYEQLENWMYFIMDRKVRHVEINVDSGNQRHVYYFVNDLPEEIIKKVKRYYSSGTLFEGLVSQDQIDINWDCRGWILENGNIISTNNGPHYEKDHLVKDTDNVVRYNFGYERYIGLPKNNLSSQLYETLEKLLDIFFIGSRGVGERSRSIEINCDMDSKGDFISKTYSPFDYTTDDILKKIKRYYSSGILYEDALTTDCIVPQQSTNKCLSEAQPQQKVKKSDVDIIGVLEDNFDTQSNPMLGPSYILPNGNFLVIPTPRELDAGTLFSYKCHSLIYAWLVSEELVKGTIWDINDMHYLEELGCIRVNLGDIPDEDALLNYIQLNRDKKPNAMLKDAILKWLDFAQSNRIDGVEVQDGPYGSTKKYTFDLYLSDEILNKIMRYYSSGNLYENNNYSSKSNLKYARLAQQYIEDDKNIFAVLYGWQYKNDPIVDISPIEFYDYESLRYKIDLIVRDYHRFSPKSTTGNRYAKESDFIFFVKYNNSANVVEHLLKIGTDLKESMDDLQTVVSKINKLPKGNSKVVLQAVSGTNPKRPLIYIQAQSKFDSRGVTKYLTNSEVIDLLSGFCSKAEPIIRKYFNIDYQQMVRYVDGFDFSIMYDISEKTYVEDASLDAKLDYNTQTIIEEKWEIADMEEDDPVEADVFISDDVRDIIREINRNNKWEYYKFILDEYADKYIMLDPFVTIHDDALYVVMDNYWYPNMTGKDAYKYMMLHNKKDLFCIMVTFGTTEDGLPNDLGLDYFNYAYMYPNFNILTRTTNFTNTELYKLLGKEDKFMDVSKYGGIQEKLKLNKDNINESVSEKISLYHGTNSIIKGDVRLPLFLADNKYDSYRYGKNLYKFNVNLNKSFVFDYNWLEELDNSTNYDENEEIINKEFGIYNEDLWGAIVDIFDGYTISYDYLIETILSLGKYDSIVLYNSPVGHGHIDLYIILKQSCIVDYNKVLNENNDSNVDMSSELDSEENILTLEQAKYFSNSKVKDKSGRLLVCYHSTDNEFDEFDSEYSWDSFGFHFGTKLAAEDVGGEIIKSCYLNITNPLILKEDLQYWDAFSFIRLLYENPKLQKDIKIDGWEEIKLLYEEDLAYGDFDESFYCAEYGDVVREALYNSKYDGIFYPNWAEDAGSTSYMCFYPEQIKYIDNKQPTRSKKMNESSYDNSSLSNQEIKDLFLDEWQNLYNSSTEHIIDLLNCKTQSELDVESPMFVLPNGEIISVQKVLIKNRFDEERTHHAFTSLLAQIILQNILDSNGVKNWDADSFIYAHENFFDGYTRGFLDVLTYKFNWIRLNCGTRYVESRFYCVLPNNVTSYQYKVLDDWLWWGEQNNKDKVLVFCSSYQDNNTYKFSENTAEDIIKKIKRYYTSGKLYESITLYRGEGSNNYSVKNNSSLAGLFFATDEDDASNFSDNVYQYELKDDAKIYKGQSSLDYCGENNLMDKEDKDLQKMLNVNTLLDMFDLGSYNNGMYYPKDEYLDDSTYFATQLIAKKHLESLGYDGAYWSYEDDLTPHQYLIWNLSTVSKNKLDEDYGDEDEEELTFWEQVEKDEQDMLDLFYTMSSDDFLNYLDVPTDDKIDKNSAMYILPNGDIMSVGKAFQQYDIDLTPFHVNLFLCFAKKYFIEETEDRYTSNQIDEILIQMENEETFTSLRDIMVEITYGLGWARVNCGKTWSEDRFYCVLPNSMTKYQFYTLEDWLIWGELNKTKNNQVIVFVDNAQVSKTYDYSKTDATDIIKSIKRYFSSGNLYEHMISNRKRLLEGVRNQSVWYHGTSIAKQINEFNQPINWFTTDKDYAKEYTLQKGYIYSCELNVIDSIYCGETSYPVFNPRSVTSGEYEFSTYFLDIIDLLELDNDEVSQLIDKVVKEQFSYGDKKYLYKLKIDVVTRTKAFRDICINCGYDSIVCKEYGHLCCGVFFPEDIDILSREHI